MMKFGAGAPRLPGAPRSRRGCGRRDGLRGEGGHRLTKPTQRTDLLAAITARLARKQAAATEAEIGTILGMSDLTVKQHLSHVFEKLGAGGRNPATLCALEVLSAPRNGT